GRGRASRRKPMIRGEGSRARPMPRKDPMIRRDSVKLRLATTAFVLSAAVLLTPGVVSAQFTTFVAPPHKALVDSAPHTVVAAKTKSDSVARMSLTDMKTWVDSAAGTSTQIAMASDTGSSAA